MSEQEAKKPGARDISDLKARLGLKKGAAGAAARTGTIPPPGAAKLGGGRVPPPPGVAPPPSASPAEDGIPDARVDPFAAMNAMAAKGAVATAPQIVLVDDGKPVESVAPKSRAARAKSVAAIALPLVVGFIVGGINYERKQVGATISDAKVLKQELVDSGKRLVELRNILDAAKERAAAGQPYKLFDRQLTDALAAVTLGIPEGDDASNFLIFHANLFNMEAKVVTDTLMYYTQLRTLADKIKEHVRKTQEDAAELVPPDGELKPARARFAVIIRSPQGQAKDADGSKPSLEIVELGAAICGSDPTPRPDGCKDQPVAGYEFRAAPAGPWGSKELAKDAVALDAIILPARGDVINALDAGGERFVEEVGYTRRLIDIDQLADSLILSRKDIENRMNNYAQKGKPLAL